jgi:TetR/AcrR family transcriptional repressor of nem operon
MTMGRPSVPAAVSRPHASRSTPITRCNVSAKSFITLTRCGGIAELMAAAGFTHGGFYKHFGSKADLMGEAAATTISGAVADSAGADLVEFFKSYVSRAHRDARDVGCTMAALCGDAARQPEDLKATFAVGIDSMITTLARKVAKQSAVDRREARAKMVDAFAHAVGAVVLSRACPDDSPLADEILEVCRRKS